MAREIANTPVLKGKDAKRFKEAMENVQPVSEEEKRETKKAYELYKSRARYYLP